MKIRNTKAPLPPHPLSGVEFDDSELSQADSLADGLKDLPHASLLTLREATTAQAMRLQAVARWANGPTEEERIHKLEAAIFHTYVLNLAIAKKG